MPSNPFEPPTTADRVKRIALILLGVAVLGLLAFLASTGYNVMSLLMVSAGATLLGAVIWKAIAKRRKTT